MRLRDVPVVTGLAISAIAPWSDRGAHGRRWLAAAALGPGLWYYLLGAPGVHHAPGTVAVQVLPMRWRTLALVLARMSTTVVVALFAWVQLAWCAASALVLTGLVDHDAGEHLLQVLIGIPVPVIAGALSMTVMGAVGSRRRGSWTVPRTDWWLSALVIADGAETEGYAAVDRLLRRLVPPGDTVGAVATTPRAVEAFARAGFDPPAPGTVVMTMRMPQPPPPTPITTSLRLR